jgi:RNA-binding protein NOB1
VKNLILDAGPLLSLTPLRGMAERFITSPSVFAELRDPRAREHWERLREAVGLEGAGVELREPDAISMAKGLFGRCSPGSVNVMCTYQFFHPSAATL